MKGERGARVVFGANQVCHPKARPRFHICILVQRAVSPSALSLSFVIIVVVAAAAAAAAAAVFPASEIRPHLRSIGVGQPHAHQRPPVWTARGAGAPALLQPDD